jgi:hypothetical protein
MLIVSNTKKNSCQHMVGTTHVCNAVESNICHKYIRRVPKKTKKFFLWILMFSYILSIFLSFFERFFRMLLTSTYMPTYVCALCTSKKEMMGLQCRRGKDAGRRQFVSNFTMVCVRNSPN